jgi:hypothetical protein
MATTTSITTTYAGEFAGEYISAALTSGKTLNDGAIAIKPNVKFKEVLKTLSLTDSIVDATCDFDPTSTVTLDERVLQPKELQVNLQLCKSDFRSDWEAISMGYSAHDNLPPKFSDYIIGHVAGKVAETVENTIWQGDDSAETGLNLFEGFENHLTSSGINIGSTTVTSGNVIDFLGGMVDAIPTAVYGKEDLTIYTPNNVYQAYVRALGGFATQVGAAGIDNKGTTFYGMNEGLSFDGIKLQRCPGMSSNRAIAAQASNLYFGTGLLADHNEVKLIDMADIDGSQNVRLVMRFTAGTQVGIVADAIHRTASAS